MKAPTDNTNSELSHRFALALEQTNFNGDIYSDQASRLLNATDNSVYQILPELVIAPRSQQDIQCVMKLLNQAEFEALSITARGGGTGTNGQALNRGIVLDCSKYLNRILEINTEHGYVRVEPGAVLDQLNDELKPHGVFFAPNLSPSNRATLGGMTNTDACGKGSRLYGKTSQHVIDITAVYSDGQVHCSHSIDSNALPEFEQLPGRIGAAYQQVNDTSCRCQHSISEQFPKLTRFMTGYDLAHVHSADRSQFNLNSVICGSEGTLAIITELKLKLTPIPQHKRLMVLQYATFEDALSDANALLDVEPAAIETIDGTILELAKTDVIYHTVVDFVSTASHRTGGVNYVEWVGNNLEQINVKQKHLQNIIEQNSLCIAHRQATDATDISNLWELRKKSVGLLGKVAGSRKPMSGVEDTVVPPERLADFIGEFRAILDQHQLTYGMFGHVDAGCLHVRPAYNMHDADDQALYFKITQQIAELTQRYGGVMWGEHGKGLRSQYVPMFFGPELYIELKKIKHAFDPLNRLNPGKIATPDETDLWPVRSPLRADNDQAISNDDTSTFSASLNCNGNGACFDFDTDHALCPSYKVSRDRRYSPKGRASLIRQWLSRKQDSGFSHQVYDSFDHCLGCKACATGCPVNINIPEQKSLFLEQHHQHKSRPLRDYALAHAERLSLWQSRHPWFWHRITRSMLWRFINKIILKMQDLPVLAAPNLDLLCFNSGIKHVSAQSPQGITPTSTNVVIVVDSLTQCYQPQLAVDCYTVLQRLGFNPTLLTDIDSGKALYVRGFRRDFKALAQRNAKLLQTIHEQGIALVGIDPSITLCFQKDYAQVLDHSDFNIELIQHWLVRQPINTHLSAADTSITLLPHCSESSDSPANTQAWVSLFNKLGLTLKSQSVGCCGMAGSYGMEAHHIKDSKKLFKLSWQQHMHDDQIVLATGFSCRCQAQRCSDTTVVHPMQFLKQRLRPK